MKGIASKKDKLTRRHAKIRARVSGTPARPRLCVFKSNRYLEAQLVDDLAGNTLVSGSTKEYAAKGAKTKKADVKKMDGAVKLGGEIAQRAKAKGITKVVFDRGGFRYSGRIAAFADAARAGGLEF